MASVHYYICVEISVANLEKCFRFVVYSFGFVVRLWQNAYFWHNQSHFMKSKLLCILLFFVYVLPAFAQPDDLNLTVNIEGETNEALALMSGLNIKGIKKVANGQYNLRIPISKGFYMLFLGPQRIRVYLEPGQSTTISFNQENMLGTVAFSGALAAENKLMRIMERFDYAIDLKLDACNNEIDCMQSLLTKRNHDLEAKLKNNALDEDFRRIMLDDIRTTGYRLQRRINNLKKAARMKGDPMPRVTLYNAAGEKVSLESFKGKYVYLDVWATWCGPCLYEAPYFTQLAETFKDKNIAFVKVCINEERHIKDWEAYIQDDPDSIINLATKKGWDSNIISKFSSGGKGIPFYVLLAPDGSIINANAPRPSKPEAAQLLQSL